MKCRHTDNIEIIEFATASTYHRKEPDRGWFHDSDFGDYTGTILFCCHECGIEKIYYHSNLPKWVKRRLLDAIETIDDENIKDSVLGSVV